MMPGLTNGSAGDGLGASPMLYCRSDPARSVLQELIALIGSEPRQKELLALRRGLLKKALPEPTRDEKRSKKKNIARLEEFCAFVLPVLQDAKVRKEVIQLVLGLRTGKAQADVLWHAVDGGN